MLHPTCRHAICVPSPQSNRVRFPFTRINKLDSHPLLDELGLKTQTTHWGFRMEADFTLEPGRVIWDSAGP